MATLGERRPVFHSEADFQFALSQVMADAGVQRIRLERRVRVDGREVMQLDITGYLDGASFVLELKYPKDAFVGIVSHDGHPEDFQLSVGEPGLVYVWKDVERIETLIGSKTFDAGAVVLLTNFKLWQAKSRPNQLSDFVLFEDRTVPADSTLELPMGTTWAPDGIRIKLESPYRCHWQDYSSIDRTAFKYLVLEPSRS